MLQKNMSKTRTNRKT